MENLSIRLPTRLLGACLLMAAAFAQQKPAPKQTSPTTKGATSGTAVLVDLNSASEKDLDALPGVGPVTAKKILDHRPYGSVDDLAKAGLTAKQVERIKPMVKVSSAGASRSPVAPSAKSERARSLPSSVTAPPAGSGMVWVNTETKAFHREGDRWYGKTKHGKYMKEADALSAGYHESKER